MLNLTDYEKRTIINSLNLASLIAVRDQLQYEDSLSGIASSRAAQAAASDSLAKKLLQEWGSEIFFEKAKAPQSPKVSLGVEWNPTSQKATKTKKKP